MWNVNQNQDANNQNANFGWNVNNPANDAGGENLFVYFIFIAEIVNICLLILFTFTSQATITMPEQIWVGA